MGEFVKTDTIIALSSGNVRAGVSVFRISGPDAFEFLERYVKTSVTVFRTAALRWIQDEAGQKIDQALILKFQAPNSFTGENMLELHCHGSLAVSEEILRLASLIPTFRVAEPGEFSRRAFENDKLDLVQAEGIADIIDAVTPAQIHQAARFVAGDASDKLTEWRKLILEASAYLAASIDFSDEGDVGESPHGPAIGIIQNLRSIFQDTLDNAKSASRIRDGIRIAILGEPNVGKSTLMNALSNRDAAIVSDIAGTTRDILEVPMVLNGIYVTLADTAGLRDTDDPIEAEGVRRARAWAESADLRIYLTPVGTSFTRPENVDLVIGTKSDLSNAETPSSDYDLSISVSSGANMSWLKQMLSEKVTSLTGVSEAPNIVRARHQTNLHRALESLERAEQQLSEFDDVDLAAFELSIASSALDQILGRVDVEDVLGEVFSGFCVGK